MSDLLAGALLALSSAILWSFANVTIQGATRRLGTWGALVWVQAFGLLAMVALAFAMEGAPIIPDPDTISAIIGGAVAAMLAYGGLFEALRTGQVAVVTPVTTSWTALSALVAIPLLDQEITAPIAAGLALVLAGNVLLVRGSSDSSDGPASSRTPLRSIGWALVSAVGFGLMVPLLGVVGDTMGRVWATSAIWGVELVLLAPVLWRTRPRSWSDVRTLGVVTSVETGGFVTMSLALGLAPVGVVSPLASLSTGGAVLLGLVLLRERLSRLALVGAAFACAGVVVVSL